MIVVIVIDTLHDAGRRTRERTGRRRKYTGPGIESKRRNATPRQAGACQCRGDVEGAACQDDLQNHKWFQRRFRGECETSVSKKKTAVKVSHQQLTPDQVQIALKEDQMFPEVGRLYGRSDAQRISSSCATGRRGRSRPVTIRRRIDVFFQDFCPGRHHASRDDPSSLTDSPGLVHDGLHLLSPSSSSSA